jgi:hypothetical protein
MEQAQNWNNHEYETNKTLEQSWKYNRQGMEQEGTCLFVTIRNIEHAGIGTNRNTI